MAFNAADLKMVDDHIAQGEHHVTRQGEIIAWLKERGHPTDMSNSSPNSRRPFFSIARTGN